MRPPFAPVSTLTAPYFERNARSSSKLTPEAEGGRSGADDVGVGGGAGVLMAGVALCVGAEVGAEVGAAGS